MQRFTFVGLLSLSVFFGTQAHAESELTCGDADALLVHMTMAWPNLHGTADASGPTLANFMDGEEGPVMMSCSRQGGSSMHPWWTCEAPLSNDKRIQCVISTSPEMTVTLYDAGNAVQKHKIACVPTAL